MFQLASKTDLGRAATTSYGDLVEYYLDDLEKDVLTRLNWKQVVRRDFRYTFITRILIIVLSTSWERVILAEVTFHPAIRITATDLPFNSHLHYYYPPAETIKIRF